LEAVNAGTTQIRNFKNDFIKTFIDEHGNTKYYSSIYSKVVLANQIVKLIKENNTINKSKGKGSLQPGGDIPGTKKAPLGRQ
jgi:hypothetical protein